MDVSLLNNEEFLIIFKIYIEKCSKYEYYKIHKEILFNLRKSSNNIEINDHVLIPIDINFIINNKEFILEMYIKILSTHFYLNKKIKEILSLHSKDSDINKFIQYIRYKLENLNLMKLINLYQQLAYYINDINDKMISDLIYDIIIK